jgi:hypothetical protein
VHGADTGGREDLLLFLESFPDIQDNDVVEIENPQTHHHFVLHARAWPVKFPLRSVSLRAALAEVRTAPITTATTTTTTATCQA